MLGRQVSQLAIIEGDVTPGMVGAARNALLLPGAVRGCAVSVQGPKLPLWHQIEFRAIAAGLLLLFGVGAAELVLQLRQNVTEAESVRVGKVAAEMDQAVSRVQVRVDAIKKLQDDIKAKNDAVNQLQKRMDLLSIDVPKRSALVLSIFSELSRTVSDEVVMDRFEETPSDGFRVTAWSLTEKSAQQFVKAYQSVMEPMGYKVVDVTVGPQIGRLSLQGYILRLRLVYVQS